MDGGPGSGNFGHKGRPGQVGGSGGGGGSAFRTKSSTSKSGYVGIQRSQAFKAIARSARSNKDYRKFVNSLSNEQADQIRQQHKQCGTSENLTAYTKRLHAMLTTTKGELPKFDKPVEGKDMSATYMWDGQPYTDEKTGQIIDTQIEDVIHKQGFDGAPKMVTQAEFDQIVKDHPEMPVLLRSYAAPDAETLQAYDDQLEGGAWYVDCGVGGAQYGQGMYCAGVYGEDKDLESALNEMEHYRRLNEARCRQAAAADEVRFTSIESMPKEMTIHGSTYEIKGKGSQIPEDVLKLEPGDYIVTYKLDNNRGYAANALLVTPQGWLFDPSGSMTSEKLVEAMDDLRNNPDFEAKVFSASRSVMESPASSTRMMTLDPSAKIISSIDLRAERAEAAARNCIDAVAKHARKNGYSEESISIASDFFYASRVRGSTDDPADRWDAQEAKEYRQTGRLIDQMTSSYSTFKGALPRDDGAFAASLGYDAINASGHGATNSYTVVLNRTKVILSEQRVRV